MAVTQILGLLDEINTVLVAHRVQKWFDFLSDTSTRLRDAAGTHNSKETLSILEELDSLFRGMGSFNDLFITNQAGHDILPGEIDAVNANLQSLQEELFCATREEIVRLNAIQRRD